MTQPRPELVDLLGARCGIVCAVGAGGKKSVLYRLVREHPGRTALTATVHTTIFPSDLPVVAVVDDDEPLRLRVLGLPREGSVAYACPSDKAGRYRGVGSDTIRWIHREGGFDATLVKADGARMRWIKAPGENEPVLTRRPDTVIAVVSARAIGEPLGERVAHRVDRVEAVTGVRQGEVLTPEAVGRLMASADGSLRGAGDARVVPLINMVDDPQRETLARAAAEAALALTDRFDRVVLTCMRRPADPVVGVVCR